MREPTRTKQGFTKAAEPPEELRDASNRMRVLAKKSISQRFQWFAVAVAIPARADP